MEVINSEYGVIFHTPSYCTVVDFDYNQIIMKVAVKWEKLRKIFIYLIIV